MRVAQASPLQHPHNKSHKRGVGTPKEAQGPPERRDPGGTYEAQLLDVSELEEFESLTSPAAAGAALKQQAQRRETFGSDSTL